MDTQEKREYLIGDVAKIVGVSRDALRFYEKKGMIHVKKKENGYRYYQEEDIWRLMYILYHRKMNTSIEEIESLVNSRSSVERMEETIARRIREEREEIMRHRRAIARLELTQRDIRQIERCLGRFQVASFPTGYCIGRGEDYREALKIWFERAAQTEGLDMAYFYNVLRLEENGKIELEETLLLFYDRLTAVVGEGFDCSRFERTKSRDCVYTVVYSQETVPPAAAVEAAVRWGRAQGFKIGARVYVNVMSTSFGGESNRYALELYVPIEKI